MRLSHPLLTPAMGRRRERGGCNDEGRTRRPGRDDADGLAADVLLTRRALRPRPTGPLQPLAPGQRPRLVGSALAVLGLDDELRVVVRRRDPMALDLRR